MSKQICRIIRSYAPNSWGLKTDEFIMEYCSFYSKIEEGVCNDGLCLDQLEEDVNNSYNLMLLN